MCQRVLLAVADLLRPAVLIADEPFVSVDLDTKWLLAERLQEWKRERGLLLILATHDLELLRRLTDRTLVMYRGYVVEYGPTDEVLGESGWVHPYTELIRAVESQGRVEAAGWSCNWMDTRKTGPGEQSAVEPAGSHPGYCCHSPGFVQCLFATRCCRADPSTCSVAIPEYVKRTGEGSEFDPHAHLARCIKLRADSGESTAKEHAGKGRETDTRWASRPVGQGGASEPAQLQPVLEVQDFTVGYRTGTFGTRRIVVLDGFQLSVHVGERVGLVGPSGCGKTTLARTLVGLLAPIAGSIQYRIGAGEVIEPGGASGRSDGLHRVVQLVPQDADLSLDPAARAIDALAEAYRVYSPRLSWREARRWAAALAEQFALDEMGLSRRTWQLSGGERRRLAIARALAAFGCPSTGPGFGRLLILDEPTSGIDVILQELLMGTLIWAQRKMKLAILTMTHDRRFVYRFCTRCLEMPASHSPPVDENEKAVSTGTNSGRMP